MSHLIMTACLIRSGVRVIRGEKMAANEARALQRPNAFPFKTLG